MKPHDPGTKGLFPMPPGMVGRAEFGGANYEYRYALWRRWQHQAPTIMFIMMNPSGANSLLNDMSINKCILYAKRWHYGALYVGNTFAFRATDQKRLLTVADPVGPDNNKWLIRMAERSEKVVFAYGLPHKSLQYRGEQVYDLIRQNTQHTVPHVLELCSDGVTPKHPLYLRGDLTPKPWKRG